MTHIDTDTLAGLLAGASPGPWDAALEAGCHGVVASVPPAGETKMVAIIGNSLESPELEPMRFANARLIALAPELAAEVISLRAQAAKDKARIERLEAALSSIIIESGGKAIPNESLTVARNLAIAALEDRE